MTWIRIQKKTLAFLYAFCPRSIHTCVRAVQEKPRSRMVEVDLHDKKCKCIEHIVQETNLYENTSASVVKDLMHMLRQTTPPPKTPRKTT